MVTNLGTFLGTQLGTDLGGFADGAQTPEQALSGTTPYSWIRMDSFLATGGKATAFVDKALPMHQLAQATDANRAATPSADPNFNGKLTATFVRANATRYVSNLPASTWAFMHDGSGATMIFVGRSTTITTTNAFPVSTTDGSSAAGMRFAITTAGAVGIVLTNGTAPIVNSATGALLNTSMYAGYTYAEAASPKYTRRQGATVAASGSPSGAPSGSNPLGTLTIGSLINAANLHDGAIAELLIWKRVLPAADLAVVQSYMTAMYGL